ncbi:MAG: amidohydrolase family protein [Halanaeroarchaeum sp.]
MELEGRILYGAEFEEREGRVIIEDGEITAIEEAPVASQDIVLPAFVNAHTHIGDSIAKEAGAGLSLDELVAPPDGLKHRLLDAADRSELVAAMARTMRFMEHSGTAAFLEFREGGRDGVAAIRDAASERSVAPIVFGRGPASVIEVADGYGASGARDGDFGDAREAARAAEKPFAIHAGERDAADIDPALELDPDLLVHMVHADQEHLAAVEDAKIPVAVCPRSNLATDVGLPPVAALREHTTVALGTDNVFLNSPSMFREMEITQRCCDVSAREVLEMATRTGAELLGRSDGLIEAGRPANLIVLDGDTDNLAGAHDAVRAVVRRAGVADVEEVLLPRT